MPKKPKTKQEAWLLKHFKDPRGENMEFVLYYYTDLPNSQRVHRWVGLKGEFFGLSGNFPNLKAISKKEYENILNGDNSFDRKIRFWPEDEKYVELEKIAQKRYYEE